MKNVGDRGKSQHSTYWLTPRPKVALPSFLGLLLIALFGKSIVGPAVGIAALIFILFFPFYIVRLLIGLKVQAQQESYRATGFAPTYAPSWRTWSGVYVALFLLTAWFFLLANELAKT